MSALHVRRTPAPSPQPPAPGRSLIAARVRAVPASGIRRFFDVLATMHDVISLGVGEPNFSTPEHIREAGIRSLRSGHTAYTSNWGILALRERTARHLESLYGASYDPQREVIVTAGVSEGLDIAVRAVVNPGEEVIVPEPAYVSYVPCVVFAGGVPVPVPTTAEQDFVPTPAQIAAAITPRTKAILLGFPGNPTGAAMSRCQLEAVVQLAQEHDLVLISDEIYDRLVYDGWEHTCVASLPGAKERTILLNGFSKAYAMTGWRIGYAAAPAAIAEAMMKIHQYTVLCAPVTAQVAAMDALDTGERDVREMLAEYARRRRLLVDGLNRIGLPCREPRGAFYAFPSIRSTGLSSEEFAERLLFAERVAVVPGNAFGDSGEGYVRCCYATSLDKLAEALRRMERFLHRLEVGDGRLPAEDEARLKATVE